MKFAYKKIPIFLALGGREIEFVYRPIIPIKITSKETSVRYEALIDSEADFCIFHSEVAEVLDISLEGGKKYSFGGMGASGLVGYKHPVMLVVGGVDFKTEVVFSPDIPQNAYGVLGQRGFFDHFRVRFVYAKKVVEIVEERRS